MTAPISASNPHRIKIGEWPWGFRCPSKTKPGITYLYDLRTQRCDCPAGSKNKNCWHRRAINDFAWATWKLIIHRMTQTDAGFALLREIEAYVDHAEEPEVVF